MAVLFAGLAFGLLLCLLLAWLPLRVTLPRFVFEDCFYYLRVARSIVNGNGSTFDGIHPTNGYHPLWLLLSILFVWPFSFGSEAPAHLLLSACAVLHALTAFLIYKIVNLGGNRTVAVFAALLWLFNYNVAGIAMCGLETSLFAFFLAATVYFYLPRRHGLSAAQSAKIGMLVGLTALSRFDGALLGFAIAGDQLLSALLRRERPVRMAGRVIPMSAAGAAMMLPWIAWSYSVSGVIFPNSGRAVHLWYSPEDYLKAGLIKGLVRILSVHAPAMGKFYGFEPFTSVSLVVCAVFLIVLFSGREKRAVGLPFIVFMVYPLAHSLYYALYFRPYNRYLYPAHLLVFTGVMATIGCWLLANRNRRFVRPLSVAATTLVAVNMLVAGVDTWERGTTSVNTHSLHWTMFNKALPWIKENVQPHEKIGAFNSGIYAYFSGRTVVNLDGVMNDSVIPALEARRLIPYLYSERITYIIDWESTLDNTFNVLGGVPDYRRKFVLVRTFEQPWGPYTGARLLVLRLVD